MGQGHVHYDLGWHPAPRWQYIINRNPGVEITQSDGGRRRTGMDEAILVEALLQAAHLEGGRQKGRNYISVPDIAEVVVCGAWIARRLDLYHPRCAASHQNGPDR
jgi:hypothetical protein